MLIRIYLLVAHAELCRLVHIVLRAVYEPARQDEPTPLLHSSRSMRDLSPIRSQGLYKGHQTAE